MSHFMHNYIQEYTGSSFRSKLVLAWRLHDRQECSAVDFRTIYTAPVARSGHSFSPALLPPSFSKSLFNSDCTRLICINVSKYDLTYLNQYPQYSPFALIINRSYQALIDIPVVNVVVSMQN